MQDQKVEINSQLIKTQEFLVSSKKSLKKKIVINFFTMFCWCQSILVRETNMAMFTSFVLVFKGKEN